MNPRDVSLRVSPDVLIEDPIWTMTAMQWGQIVAHDMSLTAGVPQTGKYFIFFYITSAIKTSTVELAPNWKSTVVFSL